MTLNQMRSRWLLVLMVPALVTGPGAAVAVAHEGWHADDWTPSGWDIALLCALAAGALLHVIGARRMARRGARVRRLERVAFWTGWAAIVLAVAPPLDRAAAARFSMHMAQHELLILVGAPLLIVGRPIVPWLWALPAAWRRRAGVSAYARPVTAAWRWVTAPVLAWVLHGFVVWIWHVPWLYEAAVRSEALHAFQHATFVGTAVFFWWGLVYGRYGRAAYGAAALFVFTTSVHTGVLGALFTFSGSPFYPLYVARAVDQQIDPVADQQLAGLYMWIPAGILLTLFALALMLAWLSESERRAAVADGPAPSPPA